MFQSCIIIILLNVLPFISLGQLKIRSNEYGSSYDPPPLGDGPSGYNYPIPIPVPLPNPPPLDEPGNPQFPGGLYEPPNQRPNVSFPPFQDEPPIPTYLPPLPLPPPLYPPLGSPPPQSDPIPLPPPVGLPPQEQYLPPSTFYSSPTTNNNPVQLRVLNMSCLDTVTSERFFRSIVRTSQSMEVPPVIDEGSPRSDCVFGTGDTFRIDVRGVRMLECGIRYCSGADRLNLCVPLRFPTVRGLRLPEDNLVTLQCRPQERVAQQTRQLRLNPQIIQGRSAVSIVSGGLQRNFETQVGLFRRTQGNDDFSQAVVPGSAVQLGEDLLLRAAVREGDGWRYSRMGTVIMQRVAVPSRRTSRDSITLIDSSGCRVPGARTVCPEQPRQINPLVTTFPFRAFMFQGAESGDEMVLTVRMLGCLQQEDCFQARFCEENTQHSKSRVKRETFFTKNNNNLTNYWQSYLEFKVVLPDINEKINRNLNSNKSASPTHSLLLFMGIALLTLFFVSLGILGFKRKSTF